MIEVQELGRSVGEIEAVKGVSVAVTEDEVFGSLGPNGAGKTTTISMIRPGRKPMTRRSIRAWSGPEGLLLMVTLFAGCTSGSPGDPSVQPGATATLAPAPTVAVPPGDGSAFHVELVHAMQNEVTVDVADESGTLVEASSGTPGDGASVEPYTVAVSNDDESTVRVTWVGGPCDSASTLLIDATVRQFLLVQPKCSGDAIASDRILVLRFSAPVDAGGVQASLQDGLDTPG